MTVSRKRISFVEFVNDERNEGSDPRPFPWRFPNAHRAERGHTTPGRRAARRRRAPSRTCESGIGEKIVEGYFRLDNAGMRVANDALGRDHREMDGAHPQIPSSINLNLPECWKFHEIPADILLARRGGFC